MAVRSRIAALLVLTAVAACQDAMAPSPNRALGGVPGKGVQNLVNGTYTANVAVPPGVIIATYDLSGRVDKDGVAGGEFTFFADTPTGTIDFAGSIICLPVNDELGRAWVGAIITRNSSTRPSHQLVIHNVGEHIWFRVADRGAGGSGDADRTTSLGFKGSGGLQTSQDYCAARPWANEGIGIQSGNLTVH